MEMSRLAKTFARKPLVTYKSYNSQYTGVSTNDDDVSHESPSHPFSPPAVDLTSHPQIALKRSWAKTLLFSFFSLLWLLPISTLLVLNIRGYTIGPSAWCPFGRCQLDMIDGPLSFKQRAKFERENHNLLGALQFVAKALEVWFILIATLLVYLLTMILAGRKEGLPIAYLTRPSEFAEIPGLLDTLLWKTLPPLFRRNLSGRPAAKKRIWIFVIFTVFLCIICNLMGPAVAVLVLPTLQWVDNSVFGDDVLISFNSASPPKYEGFTYNTTLYSIGDFCDRTDWDARNYNCTATAWGDTLDALVLVYKASLRSWNGISQQDLVSFTFNATWSDDAYGRVSKYIFWSPSRQLLSGLSEDLDTLLSINSGAEYNQSAMTHSEYESYKSANHSLDAVLIREGPVTGVLANMWMGYDEKTFWSTEIGLNKWVRCYEGYNLSHTPLVRGFVSGNYTKCVKFGIGWNTGSEVDFKYANFTIEGLWKRAYNYSGPSLAFQTWSSGQNGAAFLPNGTLPKGFDPQCLVRRQKVPVGAHCDWDEFFKVDESSVVADRAAYSNTIQITALTKPSPGHPNIMTIMLDFTALLAFTNYTLDPSPLTNPLLMVQQPDLPPNGIPIAVDPAWTLAAWSAQNNGLLGSARSSTEQLCQIFEAAWDEDVYTDPDPLEAEDIWFVDYVALIPVIQTLSLIDYSTNSTPQAISGISPQQQATIDAQHPKMIRQVRINAWAYSLSTRTGYLGVVVAIAGCLVVLFQFFLGLVDRRRYRSPAQLLVAALEHSPKQEFLGKEHDEEEIAKVRFRVEDVHHNAGKFKFGKLA